MAKRRENRILAEFEFVIDFDMAIFRMIRDEYTNSPYVIERVKGFYNEYRILDWLIHRKCRNPLELIMPDLDTNTLYKQLTEDKEKYLLEKYGMVADTFYLMVTYIEQSYSADVTIWCKNQIEAGYIKNKNSKISVLICENRADIDLNNYDVIYMKFFTSALEYNKLEGKHIYIAYARYNTDENGLIDKELVAKFAKLNIIHLIDLYRKVKYRNFKKGEDEDE